MPSLEDPLWHQLKHQRDCIKKSTKTGSIVAPETKSSLAKPPSPIEAEFDDASLTGFLLLYLQSLEERRVKVDALHRSAHQITQAVHKRLDQLEAEQTQNANTKRARAAAAEAQPRVVSVSVSSDAGGIKRKLSVSASSESDSVKLKVPDEQLAEQLRMNTKRQRSFQAEGKPQSLSSRVPRETLAGVSEADQSIFSLRCRSNIRTRPVAQAQLIPICTLHLRWAGAVLARCRSAMADQLVLPSALLVLWLCCLLRRLLVRSCIRRLIPWPRTCLPRLLRVITRSRIHLVP